MSDFAPVSIPRWQWRTVAPDLSWLFRPLSIRESGSFRHLDETHLVCRQSSHHAWLAGDTLELAWRKEVSPEGLELWDTVLRARAPFGRESVGRLFEAWGLAAPEMAVALPTVPGLLAGPIAASPAIRPASLVRRCRVAPFHGIDCSLETLVVDGEIRLQSFSIEHEDPSLVVQVLEELGLGALANTSLLQGLRVALGLPLTEPGIRSWPKRSNASTS
ncbi:MAG: hypothetical protein IPJ17_03205 [Holophagales bacterium]|nr:MAG: hypothetical protein IPJ17_03205 [Holophagales bacterium]